LGVPTGPPVGFCGVPSLRCFGGVSLVDYSSRLYLLLYLLYHFIDIYIYIERERERERERGRERERIYLMRMSLLCENDLSAVRLKIDD